MKPFHKLYLNIGAMKAGTTWLYRQLEQHPEIVFSREKELHYHAYRDGDRQALGLQYRISRFRNARSKFKQGRLSVEYARLVWWYTRYLTPPLGNTWYRKCFPRDLKRDQYGSDFSNLTAVIGDNTWTNIQQLTDSLKVTYLLRHPIDRVWSQINSLQGWGAGRLSLDELTENEIVDLEDKLGLWRHSQYSASIETLRRNVSEDDFRILFHDDIKHRPMQLLREIESFLGIGKHIYKREKIGRQINASRSAGVPETVANVFAGRLEQELLALEKLGVNFPDQWKCSTS